MKMSMDNATTAHNCTLLSFPHTHTFPSPSQPNSTQPNPTQPNPRTHTLTLVLEEQWTRGPEPIPGAFYCG